MATTTSTTGSVIDVASIVSQLMTVERQPITKLQTKESSYKTQLSAYGQIASALSTLQTAATAMSTSTKMNAMTASVADTSIASVKATNGAVASSYQLEISKLATQQKLITSSLGTSSSLLATGDGSITLEFGTTAADGSFTGDATRTKTLSLTADQMTPEKIRDAINGAQLGATATLLTDSSGSRLVLTSSDTGATQSMKLTVSDPDGGNADGTGLSMLAYDPAGTSGAGRNMTQSVAAADSAFTLDGVALSSAKNEIGGVIDGVTLTLAKTNVGTPTTLAVSADNAAITKSIDTFIAAYNSVNSLVRTMTAYDATTKTAGTLQGDSTARAIQQRLRGLVTDTFGAGAGKRLSEIGITLQTDGSLSRDATKFNAAFTSNRSAVVGLFTGNDDPTKSLASRMSTLIDSITGSEGTITSRKAGINSTIDRVDDQIATLETRMDAIEARYTKQYTTLDANMSKMSSLSSYLTQQLAALEKST
ncbi:flagellar filament capping protein FliD [soil metagenome]